jgi:predicted alpha/beta-hydrolase family hydrolase
MGLTTYPADAARDLSTMVVLAHGAGAGQGHPFMVRYARGLSERGIDVVTFDFPYMQAKRKSPDKAPVLEAAFRTAIVDALAERGRRPARLVIGGKSMGGRIATHLAAAPEAWSIEVPLAGVVALGYPLKAGKQDRVSHLLKITVPTLIVQGTRDSFGGPADVMQAIGSRQPLITVHAVNTGDHSFAIQKSSGKTQSEADAEVCDVIANWVRALSPKP